MCGEICDQSESKAFDIKILSFMHMAISGLVGKIVVSCQSLFVVCTFVAGRSSLVVDVCDRVDGGMLCIHIRRERDCWVWVYFL